MRVVFVDHKLNLKDGGGSNITMHHMACALTELGHDATIVTVSPSRNTVPEGTPYRVVERPLSRRTLDLRGRLRLVGVLRELERDADVFQIEAPSLISAGALYRLLGGKTPVVARLSNYGFFCSNVRLMNAECYRHCTIVDRIRHRSEGRLRKALLSPLRVLEQGANRLLVNRIDRFIALTPAVAEIHSWYGMDRAKMVVISPPLDPRLKQLQRSYPPRAVDGDRPFRILYTGRLSMEKGVDTLLRAAAGLGFPYAVDIVGAGDSREEFERMARELGIGSQVQFHGWVSQEEIVEYYRNADLFVHPARWPEPAGRTVLEAMALAVPIVVSNVGGPPWIAGEGALTFAPGDAAELRDRIVQIHDDRCLAQRLACNARERSKLFERSEVVVKLLDLYRSVGA